MSVCYFVIEEQQPGPIFSVVMQADKPEKLEPAIQSLRAAGRLIYIAVAKQVERTKVE